MLDDYALPSPTPEQEKLLFRKYSEGNVEVKDEIFRRYWRMAIKITTSFVIYGYDREDLISMASEYLLIAIDKFDIGKGVRFSTYAYSVINGLACREYQTYFYGAGIRSRGSRKDQDRLVSPMLANGTISLNAGDKPNPGDSYAEEGYDRVLSNDSLKSFMRSLSEIEMDFIARVVVYDLEYQTDWLIRNYKRNNGRMNIILGFLKEKAALAGIKP